MKRILCIAVTLFGVFSTFGQGNLLERQKEKTKEKVIQRTENKIENKIDQTLDKTEEELEQAGKKSSKDSQENEGNGGASSQSKMGNSQHKSDGIRATSKFDFVPGEKIIVFEDFSNSEIGDFPVTMNTNASGEVVQIEGEENRFLKLAQQGVYLFDHMDNVPENFTLEFDVVITEDYSENMSGIKLYLVKKMDQPLLFDQHFNSSTQAGIDIHPTSERGYASIWAMDESETEFLRNEAPLMQPKNLKYHVSIWRQNNRLRIYVDDTKIFDVPRVLMKGISYQIIFANYSFDGSLFLGNVRYAVGNPDTRSKLITEGKLVTRGILFAPGSDQLLSASTGTVKEIAEILRSNPDLKVKIIGHTDSDGDEKSNLILSEKRAAAVRLLLINEFGIDETRLVASGKGESEPTDSNATSAGKANNRRVEFIKLNQ